MILALTFRTILVIINVAAVAVIVAVIGYKVLSVRREPDEKPAQNLTPFLDDQELEGSHLERVLRWALLFSTIVAVVLPRLLGARAGPPDRRGRGLRGARGRAGRGALRQRPDGGLRQHQVAAVRELPRHRRRRGLRRVHDHPGRAGQLEASPGAGDLAGARRSTR